MFCQQPVSVYHRPLSDSSPDRLRELHVRFHQALAQARRVQEVYIPPRYDAEALAALASIDED